MKKIKIFVTTLRFVERIKIKDEDMLCFVPIREWVLKIIIFCVLIVLCSFLLPDNIMGWFIVVPVIIIFLSFIVLLAVYLNIISKSNK
jgi:hypothetical protein